MDTPIKEIYRRATRATLLSLAVNFTLGVVKLAGGIVGSSFALIADAVNSFGDSASSAVALASLRIAQKPADADHPYGHTRAEAIGASTVSLFIIIAALLVGWEALTRIRSGHDMPPAWTLWIAASNVVIKEGLFRYNLRIGKKTQSSAVVASAWDHRSDALCSLAALVGLGIVRWGGERFIWADEIAAIVIVTIIILVGLRLYLNSASELLDPQADDRIVNRIRDAAGNVPGVRDVEKLWVRKTGLEYLVEIHIEVEPTISVDKGHGIGHDVRDVLIREFGRVRDVMVHLEPYPGDTPSADSQ